MTWFQNLGWKFDSKIRNRKIHNHLCGFTTHLSIIDKKVDKKINKDIKYLSKVTVLSSDFETFVKTIYILSHETSIDCSHKTINYNFLGKKTEKSSWIRVLKLDIKYTVHKRKNQQTVPHQNKNFLLCKMSNYGKK